MKTWYLAHQLKNRQAIRKIQKYLESNYKINLLNPFYDTGRTDVVKLDVGEIKSRYDFTLDECRRTVNDDLMWIRNTDGVLCILKDGDAIGSFMEVFYASKIMAKPVYLICPVMKVREHLWMRALTFKVFKNVKELEAYFIENDMVQK
jgi:hypothetical protein